jgi:glyoxylase-like metal-dependent hydrolase (beta-lactamase superfamily II)
MSQSFEQLSGTLWLTHSRSLDYNSGILISGEQSALIDPGLFPDEIAGIARFIREQHAEPACIILTHSHWDHLLGPEHLPGIRIVAQRRYRSADGGLLAEDRRRKTCEEIERWEEENGVRRERPFRLPMPTQTLDGSLMLLLDRLPFQLIHAPGHWPDQLVVAEPEAGVLWAGDMLSDSEIPFVSQSLRAYEQTLDMLKGMDIRVLVPGHGRAAVSRDTIERRFAEDAAYLCELRQWVEKWRAQGSLPEMTKAAMTDGFTPSPRLAANLYPHRLNIETVWTELGGEPCAAHPGWGSN